MAEPRKAVAAKAGATKAGATKTSSAKAGAAKAGVAKAGSAKASSAKASSAKTGVAKAGAAAPVMAQGNASWLQTTLVIFMTFCVIGAVPTALGGEVFGYWRLPITSFQLAASPWSLTYDTPLTQPAPMLANATLRIVTTPGGATAIATLEPGFAVQVTRYATRAGVRWAQIKWTGPTHASGGAGWTPASALIAANGASQARNIGDMGALSPTFGQTTSALGAGFASALYFPATGASYHTTTIDQSEPLGAQVIPLLLTALYAKGIAAAQPNASSGPPQIARDLATGDAQALTFDYALVGDAQGMTTFLTQAHITGFQFVARQPLQAKGTARGLSLFYTALATGALVSQHDQSQIISLLASANSATASTVAPQSIVGSGALVVTTMNANGSAATIAVGLLTPGSGPSVVVVAIAHGPTATATQKAMQTYFGRLIAIIQG